MIIDYQHVTKNTINKQMCKPAPKSEINGGINAKKYQKITAWGENRGHAFGYQAVVPAGSLICD